MSDVTIDNLDAEIDHTISSIKALKAEIGKAIFGQDEVVDEALTTIFSGGHALLVGVPGLAKTLLAETLGTVLGLSEKRIQFTPDLMPADILGSEILDEDQDGKQHFRFIKGPIFAQLVMADEINRASPRTQAALLQAMQEHQVTVAGAAHALPSPFHVLATQNPIEQEGTYPLPEAQLDRFLLQINVDYPTEAAERDVIIQTTTRSKPELRAIIDGTRLQAIQSLVRRMPVGEQLVDAILSLVRSGRPGITEIEGLSDKIAWGPGPRAGQALMLATRVRALMDERLAPSLDDVRALAGPVLRHRMAVTFAARADGLTVDDLIQRMSERIG